jgi:hypothetical protein
MSNRAFLDLPVRDQQAVVDHVRASAALITDKLSSLRVLSDREMEDVCRWVIDAYLDRCDVDRYADGYEMGHEAGFREAARTDKAAG